MDATHDTPMGKKSGCHGPRQCDTCLACCIHLPIPGGHVGPGAKPAGVRCSHRDENGCRVYTRRPQLCADFVCAWLGDPSWPLAWRPDLSGVMCLREEIEPAVPAALMIEVRVGALVEARVQDILQELRRSTAVVATIDTVGCRRRFLGEHPARAKFEQQVPAPAATGIKRRHVVLADKVARVDTSHAAEWSRHREAAEKTARDIESRAE